jgi:hypothetical protein
MPKQDIYWLNFAKRKNKRSEKKVEPNHMQIMGPVSDQTQLGASCSLQFMIIYLLYGHRGKVHVPIFI